MKKSQLYKYIGNEKQLFGINNYTLNEGKEKGTQILEVNTMKGCTMKIVPSRGMDIASFKYKGHNISYLSKTGIVNPQYYVEDGTKGFFRNFYGGFLTTGGLTSMGSPSVDQEKTYGLHGNISNTPAYNVYYKTNYSNHEHIEIHGSVREAEVFGPNIVLHRTIIYDGESDVFELEDRVINEGFMDENFMILYHFNIGYPFLSQNLDIDIPSIKVEARDHWSDITLHNKISQPLNNCREDVFYHEIEQTNEAVIRFFNSDINISLEITYNPSQLPFLTQWKSMQSGEYAMGIEPGTNSVEGRHAARKDGSLKTLAPGEEYRISIKFCVR